MIVSVKVVWFCLNWASNVEFVTKHGVHEDCHKPLGNTKQSKCPHVQYRELLDWC